MAMRVKEVARLAGVSVRTLHHYDAICLLTAREISPAGYRLYSEGDLDRLQQILFYKELGFSLSKIKEIMQNPAFDRAKALMGQKELMLERKDRLDKILATLEKTIQQAKGEIRLSTTEKFEGFDFRHNPYEKEARKRWGNRAVDDSNEKIAKLSPEEVKDMGDRMNAIYWELAAVREESPQSKKAQEAIGKWYTFLNAMGSYSPEAFEGLGQMYVQDARFTKNIDQFGDGLSKFMCEAMAVYAQHLKTEV